MYHYVTKKNYLRKFGGLQITVIIGAVLIAFFLLAIGSISKDAGDRQEEALQTAISRSVVSCYCVEGTYPPSLEYLEQHYGLTYDKSLFVVDYKPIGSNILPEITILRRASK